VITAPQREEVKPIRFSRKKAAKPYVEAFPLSESTGLKK
jgi:hypothetical protein